MHEQTDRQPAMDKTRDSSTEQRFSSRLGMLLSALGIAVGTGNIWRFPRIAAQSGGETGAGAFLLAWLVFLFAWSIPLIIAEYALGRKHRAGPIGVFFRAAGKKFAWMGSFVALVSTAIAFFYAVVVGWCIFYLFRSITAPLPGTTEEAFSVWNGFQDSIWPFVVHLLAVGFAIFAIRKGVKSIERVNRLLIPGLLLIIIAAVIRALALPGSMAGIKYLFTPDWSQLKEPGTWLAALTQNAWDTGAGWGLFLTYAAYMQARHGAVKNAFITGIGNNTVSLLVGIMIFGTVFAILGHDPDLGTAGVLDVMKSSGPASTGLTFIWMPQLFNRMFLGAPLSVMFFLGLTFAGFSSLIAMMELATRVLVDRGLKRKTALVAVAATVYLLGIPSASNVNFLSNQDYVWGVGLIISGGFIAFAVMRSRVSTVRTSLNEIPGDWNAGRLWGFSIRYFVPAAALILLVWWMFLSATVFAADDWLNPFNPYSVMTCVLQWGVFLSFFVIANRWITRGL